MNVSLTQYECVTYFRISIAGYVAMITNTIVYVRYVADPDTFMRDENSKVVSPVREDDHPQDVRDRNDRSLLYFDSLAHVYKHTCVSSAVVVG